MYYFIVINPINDFESYYSLLIEISGSSQEFASSGHDRKPCLFEAVNYA